MGLTGWWRQACCNILCGFLATISHAPTFRCHVRRVRGRDYYPRRSLPAFRPPFNLVVSLIHAQWSKEQWAL